jgi:tetratricopeptide (TPR) repeat protein
MLAIVPEWFRLLLWPAHLRADYSPPAFGEPGGYDGRHAAGVLLLVLAAAAAWWCRRRAPAVTSGILWAAIAMLPVSNVILPTGIVLAERALLLPSVGVVLAAGGVFDSMYRNAAVGRTGRIALAATLAGVLAGGTLRSASRQGVWRENRAFFEQMQRDAPGGYRSYAVYGTWLAGEGSLSEAADQYRRAASLFPDDPRMSEDYAQVLRRTGRCEEAIPVLERVLAIDRTRPIARTRLFLCLLATGRADSARSVAREGTAIGLRVFSALEARADSALAREAERPRRP